MSEWQPIETAPRNKIVLLFGRYHYQPENWKIHSGYVQEQGGCVWNGERLTEYSMKPTHWMPLPKPPVESNSGGGE